MSEDFNEVEVKLDNNKEEIDKKDCFNIKLGLIIPHRELTSSDAVKKLKSEFSREKTVKFLSKQYNDEQVKFNIVDIDFISEATATILDDVMQSNNTDNGLYQYHPTTMSIAIDIGSHSTDFISMLGVDIINGSEKRLNIGVDDLLIEIMNKIEDKYDVPFESLDMDNIAQSLRYPTVFCKKCGTIAVNEKNSTCRCGGNFVEKLDVVRIGKRGIDVAEIKDACVLKISRRIVEYFSTYIRRIFRLRGVALNQLENITLSGGGTEIFGDCLKGMLEKELGEFVTVKKSNQPVRKNVNGLSKLIYNNVENKELIDAYIAVDVGCSAVKSKILDKNGVETIKGIEFPSRVSDPVQIFSYSIKKAKPLADLHMSISSYNNGIGEGEYFVGQLASKGEGIVRQSNFIDKNDDEIFYTLAYTSIATLLARLNHKNK